MTERDDLINKARQYFAGNEFDEFYRAVAYSGYKHALDKMHEVLADFHLTQSAEITAERDRLREFIDSLYSFGLDFGYGKWQDDKFHIFDDDGESLYSGETVMDAVEAYLKGNGDGE